MGGPDMAVEAGALGEGAAAGGTPVQLQVLVNRPAGAPVPDEEISAKNNRKISVTYNPTFHRDVDPDTRFKEKAKKLWKKC